MKKIFFILALYATENAFAQKVDFSGTYMMNKKETNLGPAPEWILPRYIKVEQQKKKTVIARTGLSQQLVEQPPVADTLAFDGAAFLRKSAGYNAISTLKWDSDTSFVVVRKNVNDMNIVVGTITEGWTMENGKKTLVVNRSVEQANGMKYTTRAVFNRQ